MITEHIYSKDLFDGVPEDEIVFIDHTEEYEDDVSDDVEHVPSDMIGLTELYALVSAKTLVEFKCLIQDGHVQEVGVRKFELTAEHCRCMGPGFLAAIVNSKDFPIVELKIADHQSLCSEEELRAVIKANPSLRSLDLRCCIWLTGTCFQDLQPNTLKELKILNCNYLELSRENIQQFASSLSSLLCMENIQTFSGISELTSLTKLHLLFAPSKEDVIEKLKECKTIQSVYIDGELRKLEESEMLAILDLPCLRKLSILGCADVKAEHFQDKKMPNLQTILWPCNTTMTEEDTLKFLTQLPSLKKVVIPVCLLGNKDKWRQFVQEHSVELCTIECGDEDSIQNFK